MSRKEARRPGLVQLAVAGKITTAEGARNLKMTPRQFRRLKARYRAEGVRGLVHRLRGRPSPRALDVEIRNHLLALIQTTYRNFNDCHCPEKLREVSSRRTTRDPQACRIDLILRSVGPQPADGGFDIVDGGRELIFGGQPVTRGGRDESTLSKLEAKRVVSVPVPGAKAAAVNAKHGRPGAASILGLRQIQLKMLAVGIRVLNALLEEHTVGNHQVSRRR